MQKLEILVAKQQSETPYINLSSYMVKGLHQTKKGGSNELRRTLLDPPLLTAIIGGYVWGSLLSQISIYVLCVIYLSVHVNNTLDLAVPCVLPAHPESRATFFKASKCQTGQVVSRYCTQCSILFHPLC